MERGFARAVIGEHSWLGNSGRFDDGSGSLDEWFRAIVWTGRFLFVPLPMPSTPTSHERIPPALHLPREGVIRDHRMSEEFFPQSHGSTGTLRQLIAEPVANRIEELRLRHLKYGEKRSLFNPGERFVPIGPEEEDEEFDEGGDFDD